MSEQNPHDKFFKQMMTKKETAADVIKTYFPEELSKAIDVRTLRISKDTFIDEHNAENQSDILYEVLLDGQEAYIYLLFEHKSYDYKYTALQLLKYMYNIWDLDIKQKNLSDRKQLKPILPFVFYSSEEPWTRGTSFSELLDKVPEHLEKYIPNFEFFILNLNTLDFNEIKGELLTKILLKTMKIVFMSGEDLEEKLEEIFHLVKLYKEMAEAEESVQVFRLLIRYLLGAAKYIEREQIEQTASQELSEWRDEYMSVADVLKKEGKQEGIKEGTVDLLWRILIKKFPTIDRGYYQKINQLDLTTIEVISIDLLDMKDPKELEKYF